MKHIGTYDGNLIDCDAIKAAYIAEGYKNNKPIFSIKLMCEITFAEYPSIDMAQRYFADLSNKLNADANLK